MNILARSYIEDYKNNRQKKEQSWFEKSIKTAVAMFATAGLVVSAWKMKGPVGKLVQTYEDDRLKNFFNKGLDKYVNRPIDKVIDQLVSTKLHVAREEYGKLTDVLPDSVFGIMKEGKLTVAASVISNIDGKENKILVGFSNAINGGENRLDVTGSVDNMGSRQARIDNQNIHSRIDRPGPAAIIGSPYQAIKSELHNDLLARIRQQTIFEFLHKGSGLGKADFGQVHADLSFYQTEEYFKGDKLLDPENRKIIERTSQLHKHLLETEPDYAALYSQNLSPLVRRAQLDPDALPQKLKANPLEFRKRMYGDVVPAGTEIENIMINPTITDLCVNKRVDFGKIDALTGGGRHPIKSTHRLLGELNVEYGSYVKRIIDVLNKRVDSQGSLASFDMSVESFDFLDGERRYLTINLVHRTAGPMDPIKIPLETNGYIPTGSPSGSRKIGRFYDVENVFTMSDRSKLIRSTPFLLHELGNYFESTAMTGGTGGFKGTPKEIIKNITNIVSKHHASHPPESGSARDLVPMFSVMDPYMPDLVAPGPKHSANLRRGYSSFVANMNHMSTIAKSDKRSVVIAIDLESLSNNPQGPEFHVNDVDTQFVKAGIKVADMNTKTVLEGTEIASTHGYKHFKKTEFGKDLQEWIRSNVIPNGENIPPGQVEQAYEKYLQKIGATNFNNNAEFFNSVKNNIESLRIKYANEGYNVYFVTKNGTNFDLRAFEYHLRHDTWLKDVVMKNHIDIQATAGVLRKGYFSEGALSSEAMLSKLLGDMGEIDLASQVTHGHNMTPDKKKLMVKKIINVFGRKGSAGVGALAGLLNMSNSLYEQFDKKGLLDALHASPLLDCFGTLGMFVSQYEQLSQDPMWKSAAGEIARVLRSGSVTDSAFNIVGVLQAMVKKTYDRFGVLSFSALSHGMIHNMLPSFVTLADINNMSDNPLNKQFNQLAAQEWNFRASPSWITKHGNVKTTDIIYKRKFGQMLSTGTINEFLNQILPKADDAAHAFSKSAMMKGCVMLDFTKAGGAAGQVFISEDELKKYDMVKHQTFDVSDEVIKSDVLLSEHVHQVRRDIVAELKRRGIDPGKATVDQIESASMAIKSSGIITLSEEILGASKFAQLKLDKKVVNGRIIWVANETNVRGIGSTKIKFELVMSALDMGNSAVQARIAGEKSTMQVAKTFADKQAHGLIDGFRFSVHNKALEKAQVGATKEQFLNNVLVELFDAYHNKHTSPIRKNGIEQAIKEFQHKIAARIDPKDMSTIFNYKDMINDLGSTTFMLEDIAELAKKGGHVWSAQDISELKAIKGRMAGVHALAKSVEDQIKLDRDQILRTKGYLTEVDKLTFNYAATFAKIIVPREGEAKLSAIGNRQIAGVGGSLWDVVIPTYNTLAIYGDDNVRGTVLTNQRLEYLLPQRLNPNLIGKKGIEWFHQHAAKNMSAAHRSAYNTMTSFRDVLMGTQMFKPMSLQQLDFVIDRDGKLAAAQAAHMADQIKTMSAVDQREMLQSFETLITKNAELNDPVAVAKYTAIAKEVTDLINDKGASEFLSSHTKSRKFFTQPEVKEWQEMIQKNNGIVAMELPSTANNVYQINLKTEVADLCGRLSNAHYMSEAAINERGQTIIDALIVAKEKAGKKAPFNITKEGMLEMGSIFIPWDKNGDNNFNLLGPNTFLSTFDTQIKMDLMKAVGELNNIVNKKIPGDVSSAKTKVNREFTKVLMLAFGMDKNTVLWESMQLTPPALMPKHQGIEAIKKASFEELSRMKNGYNRPEFAGFKFEELKTMFSNISKADIDTVLITESMFRSVENPSIVDGQFTGIRENYARKLETNLKEYHKGVRNGQRLLPGGIMARYPQTQSGGESVLATKYLVIPDQVAGYIGMNNNSFYAHSFLFSWLQGSDNDGDIAALHFQEINSIADLNERMAENTKTLQAVSDLPEVRDLIGQSRIKRDHNNNITSIHINQASSVEGWTNNGKAMVSITEYNSKNQIVSSFEPVDAAALDYSDFSKSVLKFAQDAAHRTPGVEGHAEYLRNEALKPQMAAFSKTMIPASTNLLKKRMFELAVGAEADRIPGGARAAFEMIGGISNNLVGLLGQLPIELAKHHEPAKLASAIKVFELYSDPVKNRNLQDEVFEQYYDQTKNYVNRPTRESVRSQFDYEINHFANIQTINSLNPELKTLDRSIYGVMSGKQSNTLWDYLYFSNFDPTSSTKKAVGDMITGLNFKVRLNNTPGVEGMFKKAGKGAAIAAAVLLGASLFKPFSPSNSLSPADSFISLGDINSQHNLIQSSTELPRGVPLDMVDSSFSKEAYIKMNNNTNSNKHQSTMVNGFLRSSRLSQPYDIYRVPVQPKYNYANYTTSIPYMGTSDLQRRANL